MPIFWYGKKKIAIAPLLLNIVLETAIRRYKAETKQTVFDKCSRIRAFADDVVIMGRSLRDMKKYLRHLYSRRLGWE